MCDLIVMTFDNSENVNQIRYVMRQLQENHPHNFDATLIIKDHAAKLHAHPLKDIGEEKSVHKVDSANTRNRYAPNSTATVAAQSDQEVIGTFPNDQAFIQVVIDSIPNGGAALFVLVDDDSSAALLTMLMLFSPNTTPVFMPEGLKQSDKADAHFHADLESYQAAVANLEVLRSDSTEGDVEVVFKAVDDAYDRLVRFVYAEQETEDT